jgi:hypothetical protein
MTTMAEATRHRTEIVSVSIIAISCLLSGGAARAQVPPSAPSVTQRINVGPAGGVLATTSPGLKKPVVSLGFTAEGTLFTDSEECSICPDEIGAGIGYLATAARMQVRDELWLSTYWVPNHNRIYLGVQLGYTTFTASAVNEVNDTKETVFLEAAGARGAFVLGIAFSKLYVELLPAARYFPAPKSVKTPLSSDPFWALSCGIHVGVTLGESLKDKKDNKKKDDELKAAEETRVKNERAAAEIRWAEEKQHRKLQQQHWEREQEHWRREQERWKKEGEEQQR